MPHKRPLAVVVIAVLQLVFGAVSLCGAVTELSGAAEQVASVSQVNVPGEAKVTQQDVLKYWRDNLPSEWAVERVSAASGVVLSLMMIASAVGLLQMRAWGLFLALAYAALSLVLTVAEAVYNFGVRAPALAEFTRQLAATGGRDAQMAPQVLQVSFLLVFVVSALTAVYPLLVLLVLLRPSVRAAFRGEALPEEPEDYRDAAPPGDLTGPDDRYRTGEG
jgi:hypothetical protein